MFNKCRYFINMAVYEELQCLYGAGWVEDGVEEK